MSLETSKRSAESFEFNASSLEAANVIVAKYLKVNSKVQ